MNGREDFYEKETACESRFHECEEYWHLCTPGHATEILFTDENEFSYGMLLMGIAADHYPEVHLYTFELMSNHIHIVMSGEADACKDFFDFFKKRLKRYFISTGRKVDLSGFEAQLIPIQDLNALRNEIVYVNRNGYLVDSSCTPFSYLWGAGAFFFNVLSTFIGGVNFNNLTDKKKREVLHGRNIVLSDSFLCSERKLNNNHKLFSSSEQEKVKNDVPEIFLLPTSFCEIAWAESFFRDAHHYFYLLSKNFEAYSQIADRLGDRSIITDEELYSAAISISSRKFNLRKISSLSMDQKISLARSLHEGFRTNNRQLQRLLKLDSSILETLYPQVQQ